MGCVFVYRCVWFNPPMPLVQVKSVWKPGVAGCLAGADLPF